MPENPETLKREQESLAFESRKMSGYPPLKKPKIEIEEKEAEEEEEEPEEENNDGDMEEQIRKEQEEALVALIEHRTKEVEHLRQRITYYNSQVFILFCFVLFLDS